MQRREQNHLVLAAFVAMILIAGANAVAVRFTIREIAPFWSATMRFSAGATIFLAMMAIRNIPFPTGRGLLGDVMYGILGFGFRYALFYGGVQRVSAEPPK